MRLPRMTIAGMIGVVAFFGLAFAALRNPTDLWAECTFLVTLVVLLLATLRAIILPEPSRRFWQGFALFGWAYRAMTIEGGPLSGMTQRPLFPTSRLFAVIYSQAHRPVLTTTYINDLILHVETISPVGIATIYRFDSIGHSLFTIIFGMAGGLAASRLATRKG